MKHYFILIGALLLLTTCSTEIEQVSKEVGSDTINGRTVLYASTESCSNTNDTKVYADQNLKVLWNADDRISVFNMTTYNYQYAFTGDDGDTAGGFEELPVSGLITAADIDYIYAVYPYSKNNKMGNDCILTLSLPAEQYYKAKSFGIGANTMVAVTDGQFLAFKNVGGYLSLQLYGENVSVSRITIQGNNGGKIAGKAAISMPMNGLPAVTMDESATEAISIVCNPAVRLGVTAAEYTDFWFVIPPVTFTNGFKITVTDSMGGTFVKSTSKQFSVSRNQLDWMNPLKVSFNYGTSGLEGYQIQDEYGW